MMIKQFKEANQVKASKEVMLDCKKMLKLLTKDNNPV